MFDLELWPTLTTVSPTSSTSVGGFSGLFLIFFSSARRSFLQYIEKTWYFTHNAPYCMLERSWTWCVIVIQQNITTPMFSRNTRGKEVNKPSARSNGLHARMTYHMEQSFNRDKHGTMGNEKLVYISIPWCNIQVGFPSEFPVKFVTVRG